MTERFGTVVVGASVSAEAFTARLRELGFTEEILVIDQDPRMPYERPPLSKGYLVDPGDTEIAVDWDELAAVTVGRAVAVDPVARTVTIEVAASASTRTVGFDRLIVTTGASPVHLPIDPDGVLTLRTAQDADWLRSQATPGARVGIIGAGAIGCELATSLGQLGVEAVLLDLAPGPLQRLLGGHLGADVTAWLTDSGVECRWGVQIASITGQLGQWVVGLADGDELRFDALLSAVGARPVTAWLADSGLLSDGALVCDSDGRVLIDGNPVEGIYAAGDVVTRVDPVGHMVRTESWSAAAEQGRHLADVLMGESPAAPEVPYFWTDVAGRKIQVLGTLPTGGTLQEIFSDPDRGAVLYQVTANGEPAAWIGVNAPARIAQLRMAAYA